MTGEELRWALARLQEVLQNPAPAQANFLGDVYGAHWMYALVAEPADAAAEALGDVWEATFAGIREDPGTSAVDRVRTLYGNLCLLATRQPDQAPPRRLVRTVQHVICRVTIPCLGRGISHASIGSRVSALTRTVQTNESGLLDSDVRSDRSSVIGSQRRTPRSGRTPAQS